MEKVKKIIKEYIGYIIIIVAVLLVKEFVASPIIVSGDSMYSTLHDGDVMILDKMAYRDEQIKRFDIVVIKNGEEVFKLQTIFNNTQLELSDVLSKSLEIISDMTSYTSIMKQ